MFWRFITLSTILVFVYFDSFFWDWSAKNIINKNFIKYHNIKIVFLEFSSNSQCTERMFQRKFRTPASALHTTRWMEGALFIVQTRHFLFYSKKHYKNKLITHQVRLSTKFIDVPFTELFFLSLFYTFFSYFYAILFQLS